jgi:acyl transferase domain-containing protein/acyl carrier protein
VNKNIGVKKGDIAVVGIACRFPGAENYEVFWDNLKKGRSSIVEIPESRWDWKSYWGDPQSEPNKSNSKWGGFVEDFDAFDRVFFNCSPQEVERMDPQQRIMLELSWSCFEDAGICPTHLSGKRTGVFLGVFNHDYKELQEKGQSDIAAHYSTGTASALIANRISHCFNFKGPSIVIDTACSSSLHALHLAVQSINQKECDCALAGGISLLLTPTRHISFSKMGMLSPTGSCKTFDKDADGYVRGEGAGLILLKPAENAIAESDRIYGIIKGSAVNHGGKSYTLTYPNSKAQSEVIIEAMKRADVAAESISYMEAHGTGTPKGDPIEFEGLVAAFAAAHSRRKRNSKSHYCGLGSGKPNIGHLESAAGIASVIKVLLSMKYKQLPGLPNFKELNPRIAIRNTPFFIVDTLREWKQSKGERNQLYPRRAGVSSFGFGGTNAHVIIEEYTAEGKNAHPPIAADSNIPALFVLSAKTEEQLKAYAVSMANYIRSQVHLNLIDIAYTLQVGREAMECRMAFAAATKESALEYLLRYGKGDGAAGVFTGKVKNSKERASSPESAGIEQRLVERWPEGENYGKMADAWVKGATIAWQKLYGKAKPFRIGLPTYPFMKERYCMPEVRRQGLAREDIIAPLPAQSHAQPTRVAKEATETMLFEEYWEQKETLPLQQEAYKTLVCFCGENTNLEKIATQVQALHQRTAVILISAGNAYEKRSEREYRVVRTEKRDYEEAFRGIREAFASVDGVLYLASSLERDLSGCYGEIVCLVQAISAADISVKRLLLAGCHRRGIERCYAESWIGFEQSIGLIMPNLSVSTVLEERETCDKVMDIGPWIERVCRELPVAHTASVSYRSGKRHIRRIRPCTALSERGSIKHGGTFLITGGLGGIGLKLAEYLTKIYNAKVVLTGRSSLTKDKEAMITALEGGGGSIGYEQADVCDPKAMARVLRAVHKRFGNLNGVIHAAGVEGKEIVLKKNLQTFQEVLRPKVQGTLALDEALNGESLDFICYFSSTSAILGDFGTCDYAIGNRFELSYAAYRNDQERAGKVSGKALVINWPLWRDGGMGFSDEESSKLYLNSSGQRYLETDTALELFDRLLGMTVGQAMVIVGNRNRVYRFLDVTPESPSWSNGKQRRVELTGLPIEDCVEWDVKEIISQMMEISRDRIHVSDNLSDHGFDSIGLAEFARRLSGHFGVEVTPALFFGHSTVERLVGYLVGEQAEAMKRLYRVDSQCDNFVQAVKNGSEFIAPKAFKGLKYLSDHRNERSPSPCNEHFSESDESIAIIGMSGRFPQARNINALWSILNEGRDVITTIPEDRRACWEENEDNGNLNESGYRCGYIPGVSEFDPLFFEISPKEAEEMDPRQRLLLQESWRAIEDAGYGPRQLRGQRVGMFVGVEHGVYQYLSREESGITSNHEAILASRLGYFLNFTGPVLAINTACSSGLAAVHQACLSIRAGECDMALAAGVNLMVSPRAFSGMNRAGMLSEDGVCYAFDKRANGLVPGEAVAAIVLKRASAAEADGDGIYAVIKGSGMNYDGKTNGITAPSGVSQVNLLQGIYDRCRINPEEIEYVVAHGTGTRLGDPVEINALQEAFKKFTEKRQYCAVTSIKTNIGHTLAASGIVNLIGLVLAFRHEQIPASLHCEQESEYISWKESPFYVNKTRKRWPERAQKKRLGAVSSFGMSGTNVHMVLESHSRKDDDACNHAAPCYLLAFSAKSVESLQEKISDIIEVFRDGKFRENSLSEVSYTLLEGRFHFAHRCAAVIKDYEDAVFLLQQAGGREKRANLFHGKVPRDFLGQKPLREYGNELLARAPACRQDTEGYREILYAIADLYCQGYILDWEKLYGDARPRRLSLPTYPFARTRFWTENRQSNENSIHSFDADHSALALEKVLDEFIQGTITLGNAMERIAV